MDRYKRLKNSRKALQKKLFFFLFIFLSYAVVFYFTYVTENRSVIRRMKLNVIKNCIAQVKAKRHVNRKRKFHDTSVYLCQIPSKHLFCQPKGFIFSELFFTKCLNTLESTLIG